MVLVRVATAALSEEVVVARLASKSERASEMGVVCV